MKVIIIEEREGWTWRIEQQENTDDYGGVDIVYTEDDGKTHRTCIGALRDAEALAKAILTYVELIKREHKCGGIR
jgi:hypothetical protein